MSVGDEIDIDYLKSWIGREEALADIVSIDLVQKFNATLNLKSGMPERGQRAPLLINYCLAQPTALTCDLGMDGHPRTGGFLPPVPLPRRMWAGSTLQFHGDLRVGDIATRVSRITDVEVKKGQSGTLCFVSVHHKTGVDGTLKIEETQSIVYREAARGPAAATAKAIDPAPRSEHSLVVNMSSALLFRYSALTFNGHRIHYDRPYATEVEHYPGLVVHGPLQATLLLNYAAELVGVTPKQFTFRSSSPIFEQDEVHLHALSRRGDTMRLWSARKNGPVAMSAEAFW